MRKLIRRLTQDPATTVTGCGAGVVQIREGIAAGNYWLVASGALTILMGIFAKDGGK
jgi:uncharacterized membrane protein HdeD (DUF308 family)